MSCDNIEDSASYFSHDFNWKCLEKYVKEYKKLPELKEEIIHENNENNNNIDNDINNLIDSLSINKEEIEIEKENEKELSLLKTRGRPKYTPEERALERRRKRKEKKLSKYDLPLLPSDDIFSMFSSNSLSSSSLTTTDSYSSSWNTFFSHHSTGSMYKPRRYLIPEFSTYLLPHLQSLSSYSQDESKIILEVGCGYGSTISPILKEIIKLNKQLENDEEIINKKKKNLIYLASDYSIQALSALLLLLSRDFKDEILLNNNSISNNLNIKINSLVWDITKSFPIVNYNELINNQNPLSHLIPSCPLISSSDTVPTSLSDSSISSPSSSNLISFASVIFCIFTLSAVHPKHYLDCFKHLKNCLLKNSSSSSPPPVILFRDFGLYDNTMFKHPSRILPHTFRRADNTLCHFFTIEEIKKLAEDAGLKILELDYHTVKINHHKIRNLKRENTEKIEDFDEDIKENNEENVDENKEYNENNTIESFNNSISRVFLHCVLTI